MSMNSDVPFSKFRTRRHLLTYNKIVFFAVGVFVITIYFYNTRVILTTQKSSSQVTLNLFSVNDAPIITAETNTTRIVHQLKDPVTPDNIPKTSTANIVHQVNDSVIPETTNETNTTGIVHQLNDSDTPETTLETNTTSIVHELNNSVMTECNTIINSERWLKGPRYGNIHQELQADDEYLVQQMILNISSFSLNTDTINDHMSTLLRQSLCYPQSHFLNTIIPQSYDTDDDFMDESLPARQWAVKLIYLSIHYHQHHYAIPEAEQRYAKRNDGDYDTCQSQSELTEKYGVGRFDYECRGAKYLVMALGGNGLGANVRGGMVPAMMLGLMVDRVVLFMNNIPVPPSENTTNIYLDKVWTLASCSRKDYQCFFWPVSPCVLTEDDILNAYPLSRSESRRLIKRNELPANAEHHKVWIWSTAFQPISGFHPQAAEKLYQYAQRLVQQNIDSGMHQKLLNHSLELIRTDDGLRDLYHYAAASYKIQHTLTMYALRPHQQLAQKLEKIISDIIPKDFHSDFAIGLPVRASDKCHSESECLSFSQHMTVTGEMWEKHLNRTSNGTWIFHNDNKDMYLNRSHELQPTVIFTTEATSMVKEHNAYIAENQTVLRYPYFQFQFMTNHHDVTPNSGFMRSVDKTNDADTIMISALSSLKAQLLPRITIGNCCSNFHILINDFLMEGCGAASSNTFHCIQETDDPLLVVCCGWHHHCQDHKKQLLLEIMEQQRKNETDSQ